MSAPDPTVEIADAEKPTVEMLSSSLSLKNSYKAAATDRPGQRGNVLAHYTEAETMKMGKEYAAKYNLDEDLFARAAALARCPADFGNMDFLTDSEKEQLTLEVTKNGTFLGSWLRSLLWAPWPPLSRVWTSRSLTVLLCFILMLSESLI